MLCVFQRLQHMVIFNKVVVCPASSPSPGFNRWGLLWCFWGLTHPLWVRLRSEPGHCVVEIQCPLHCLFWKTSFLALCEGQCGGELLNERTSWEIYSGFGHILDMLSIWESGGESDLSRFGLAWWTMMDLTYFCVTRIPMLIFLLHIVHRHDRKNCYRASQRHFNGVLVEMETDPSEAPPLAPSLLSLFPPLFPFFLSILTLSSTPTAGRTQL